MLSNSALNFSEQIGGDSSTGDSFCLYSHSIFYFMGRRVIGRTAVIDLKEQITQISGFVIGEGGDVDKIIATR
jgi:hypothetical protein